jgi:hypothetical protein
VELLLHPGRPTDLCGTLTTPRPFQNLRCFHLATEAYEKAKSFEDEAAAAKTDVILAELKEAIDKAGFSKDDEVETLKKQADADKQKQMAEAGCTVM